MEKIIVEKTVSKGFAIAPAHIYKEPDFTPEKYAIGPNDADREIEKFEEAKDAVLSDLQELARENAIFAAHVEIANDIALKESVCSKIKENNKNVQEALWETVEEFAMIFSMMEDEYMKEREADVKDIGKRLISKLKKVELPDLGAMQEDRIIVAKDLYPSDTAKMNVRYVKGIITEEGGVTGHVSIMAKSMNIPILVGVGPILDKVLDKALICMDAASGTIVIDPQESVLAEYSRKKAAYEAECARLASLRTKEAITKAGKRISLCANVGNIDDIKYALQMNIDGVGLFRSEFLYMQSDHFPTEEEQFQVYKEAVKLCPKEMTIRTLDIGGDKGLPYFTFEEEENPFLGWRAIRICLDKTDIFKEQIKAILRASAYGNARIMFPMIISMEELKEATAIVAECKDELKKNGITFDENIEVGMMIETPAALILAEEFAQNVDFFSIGTNDLTQYLLAVDRGNNKVADRYSYLHPAVVKAIDTIIRAGHKAGIKVGMCGEMAGDPKAIDLLLRMGLDEFSMSAGSIDLAREIILNT